MHKWIIIVSQGTKQSLPTPLPLTHTAPCSGCRVYRPSARVQNRQDCLADGTGGMLHKQHQVHNVQQCSAPLMWPCDTVSRISGCRHPPNFTTLSMTAWEAWQGSRCQRGCLLPLWAAGQTFHS